MRLVRPGLLATLVVVAVAAWPQDLGLPPVDHSQHPMVEVPDDLPIPSMIVRLYPDRMDGFNLFLETRDFEFTPEGVGTDPIANTGHAHLYVNGEKIARMYAPWHHLPSTSLRDGLNRLEIEFSTNDHAIWSAAGRPIGADVLIDTRDMDGDPIVREIVRYTLDWRWGAAKPVETGGWEVRTDRGFLVRVASGRLVTRGLELLPCHAVPAGRPVARRFGLLVAEAGHSSLTLGESRITKSVQEDLANPRRVEVESRTVTDPEYCQAHYLLARPDGSGPGALSLEVSGTWSAPGSSTPTPFQIETAGAFGQFVGLRATSGTSLERRSIVGGIDVTVSRPLGAMFDGVDFSAADWSTAGSQVLRSVVRGTQAVVEGT